MTFFYQQFNVDENHLNPSANFLILVAVLWFCFSPEEPMIAGCLGD